MLVDGSSRGSVLWRLRGIVAPVPAVIFYEPLFADGPIMLGPERDNIRVKGRWSLILPWVIHVTYCRKA